MKMPNNPAKYEVLIKQYLRAILDISVLGESVASTLNLIEVPLYYPREPTIKLVFNMRQSSGKPPV